ncbi:hypothetical protein M7I_0464 [Glarea lozoyensis 74030]|uniref:Uncharacterized protein n=1 Tax=Glarea lozoyensis (strain ATCC 74030 / MF5533) TaxID=1104152 RepID=H0EDF5_GLAL7|nr:hypothetical protein M7I_0464 [Glarea lozoyensis 74030]
MATLRHPAATAPAAPSSHAQYPSHRHDPPRYDPDSQASERPLNSYSHQPQTGPYSYPPNSNQMSGPHDASYNQPRYPHDPRPVDEGWKGNTEDDRTKISPFKQGLKRRYMVWDFENYLSAQNEQTAMLEVQHRENTGKSAAYYDHEAQNNVYMHDPKGEVFGGPESKKRRGSQMANGSSIRPKSMDGVSPRPLTVE